MGMLADKVVVVSGVGPGLGQALARRAADHGAAVVLAARTQQNLDDVAETIGSAGGRTLSVRTDITSDDDVQHLVDQTLAEFGRVDAVINNAFLMPPMTTLMDVDDAAVQQTFNVSLFGSLRVTRAFAPALAETQGAILFVNSVVLKHSEEPYGPYKLAKTSLLAAAQNLAAELGPRGIRVNTIAPGWIWADALKGYFAYLANERGVTVDDVYAETARRTDLRRLPEPDNIADAGLFFCSDLAHAVTGQCLEVSCGEYHH